MNSFDKIWKILTYNLKHYFTEEEFNNIINNLSPTDKIIIGCRFNIWLF
jgi:hypothetical protein